MRFKTYSLFATLCWIAVPTSTAHGGWPGDPLMGSSGTGITQRFMRWDAMNQNQLHNGVDVVGPDGADIHCPVDLLAEIANVVRDGQQDDYVSLRNFNDAAEYCLLLHVAANSVGNPPALPPIGYLYDAGEVVGEFASGSGHLHEIIMEVPPNAPPGTDPLTYALNPLRYANSSAPWREDHQYPTLDGSPLFVNNQEPVPGNNVIIDVPTYDAQYNSERDAVYSIEFLVSQLSSGPYLREASIYLDEFTGSVPSPNAYYITEGHSNGITETLHYKLQWMPYLDHRESFWKVRIRDAAGNEAGGGGRPDAAVLGFHAVSSVGGVELKWCTLSERLTDKFVVTRSATPEGPFAAALEVQATGTDSTGSEYCVIDPNGGSLSYYRLGEREVGGWRRIVSPVMGVDETLEDLTPSGTQGAPGFNPLYGSISHQGTLEDALIICPDAWQDSVEALRSHWDGVRQHATLVATLSSTGLTRESIRSFIRSRHVNYVLLVGDADGSPAGLTIPLWYVNDELEGRLATDAPYGDTDGDGLADIAIGRWPAHSSAEVGACVRKSIDYDLQSPNQPARRRWKGLIYDISRNDVLGSDTREWAVDLFSSLPYAVGGGNLFATSLGCGDYLGCYSVREAAAVGAINAGVHVVVAMGSGAYHSNLCDFIDSSSLYPPSIRFTMDRLERNEQYAFYLALSCYLGDIEDEGWPPRALAEEFIVADRKGAIAWLGPTGPSYQIENYWVGKAILSRLEFGGTRSLGEICAEATRAVASAHPIATTRASSYIFLGDPTLVMAWGDIPTDLVGRSDSPGVFRISPNPGNGCFDVRFTLTRGSDVRLNVYDIGGRRIRSLERGSFATGQHVAQWDGRDEKGRPVAAGVYLVQLHVADRTVTQKIVLMK